MQEVKKNHTLLYFSHLFCTSYLPIFFKCYLREILYDDEGNVLDEKPKDPIEVEKRKKIAMVRNKVEDAIQKAKSSNDAMNFLLSSVLNIDASLGNMILSAVPQRQEEYENFVGCEIPEEIQIHPPNDVRSKGRCKRIKRAKELPKPRKGNNAKKLMKEALQ
jgi:hypothetical protein